MVNDVILGKKIGGYVSERTGTTVNKYIGTIKEKGLFGKDKEVAAFIKEIILNPSKCKSPATEADLVKFVIKRPIDYIPSTTVPTVVKKDTWNGWKKSVVGSKLVHFPKVNDLLEIFNSKGESVIELRSPNDIFVKNVVIEHLRNMFGPGKEKFDKQKLREQIQAFFEKLPEEIEAVVKKNNQAVG